MHEPTIQYYDKNAKSLSAQYGEANVTDLHAILERWLPDRGTVLEIGCGTGREAAWMAARGLDVTATDASAAMLAEAQKNPDAASVRFEHACFPMKEGSPLLQKRFDAIVCNAVLMHVPDNDLFDTLFQMRELLNPSGRVVCSFCINREPNVADPRLFINREPQEVQLLFERIGFSYRARSDNADGLGRPIIWSTLIFDYESTLGGRPVDQIETVINHDKKTATYKLALLRALCDLAQSGYRNVQWHHDKTVSVPLKLISEKWLYYYWPLFETPSGTTIQQIRGKGKLLFGDDLTALIERFSSQNQLSGFHCALESHRLDATAEKLLQSALKKIGEAIVKGPVTYATQGGFAFDRKMQRVHFNAGLWREMCLLGHWISDTILFRWADLCVDLSDKTINAATVLGQLIVRPETERDVCDVRRLYRNQKNLTCVWTQTPLQGRRFDVDHIIPFALWHNNDLWNLLPSDSKVNNEKRDRLVSRDTLIVSRGTMIDYWKTVRTAMPERFDLEISRTLFGRNNPETQWEKSAFSALVEAVETLAIQRNIERWSPTSLTAGVTVPTMTPKVACNILEVTGVVGPLYIRDSDAIRDRAFKTALPIVGRAAAGLFFDGFEADNLEWSEDLDWVEVSHKLCGKNRFVVRVDGDSMEPLFQRGELLVFEYHRSIRPNVQIVIAADFTASGVYAVKRFKEDPTHWCFISENPAYNPILIPKDEMPQYPILGTFVGRV